MLLPTDREPTHPGEMLYEEFLEPFELSQTEVAERMGISFVRLNEIVNGRRGITASTALRLAKFFGTTPGFWMNLQQRWDLYFALQDETDALEEIARRR